MEGIGRVFTRDLDTVHVLHASVPYPDRRRRVRLDRLHAPALPREQSLAARRVHGPFAADRRARPVRLLDDERISGVAAQRDVHDLRGPPDLGPFLRRQGEDVLVELLPVDLERRRAGELRRPGLRGFPQARDLLVVEPVAECLLDELLARKVVVDLQLARQEIGRAVSYTHLTLPTKRI